MGAIIYSAPWCVAYPAACSFSAMPVMFLSKEGRFVKMGEGKGKRNFEKRKRKR